MARAEVDDWRRRTSAMTLLERAAYFDELHHLLREATKGQGHAVFLAGEAGVGKTSLVDSFCANLPDTISVVRGACDPLSAPRPLGPFADIAVQLGGELVRKVTADVTSPMALYTDFLAVLSETLTVVVIEDLHWADEATLDLLRYLGRRIGSTKTLLLATFRDDEVASRLPLRLLLGDLATAPGVRRLALKPLSVAAVGMLAGDSGLDAGEVHRLTDGNPFFVTEIVLAGGTDLPATIRDAVLARVARLPEGAREALDVAAVIGSPAEIALMETVGHASPGAIDACLQGGLLIEDGPDLRFRHELARMAVLDEILPNRARSLHQAVLLALRQSENQDISRLAHHAEGAGDVTAVLEYATAAAKRASSVNAHRDAAAFYAMAGRYLDRWPTPERAEILRSWSWECVHIEDLDRALQTSQAALDLLKEAGDPVRIGECLYQISVIHFFFGNGAEGEAAANAALTYLESAPPGPELARLYGLFAGKNMVAWDMETAVAWGRRAIELSEFLGEIETKVRALRVVASANYLIEGPEAGQAQLRRSLTMALEHGLDDIAATCYTDLGSGQCEMYRFAEADAAIDEGIAYCAARDMDHRLHYLLAWKAISRDYQGRWKEALEIAATVLKQPRLASTTRIVALTAAGRVRSRRGDPSATDLLDEALAFALPTGELQRLGPVRTARAEHAWLAGDLDRVRREAEAVYDMALRTKHQWYIGQIAYWLWRAGESPSLPANAFPPFAAQIAGKWREAAALWRKLGCPYEAAIALADGNDEADLRYAHAELTRLGASPAAAMVAGKLRESGATRVPRGPRPSTQSHPFHLTNRELEVLAMIADEQETSDIAELLFLSPRTVGHHISAILRKLDVPTRTEAVAKARANGIVAK